MNSIFNHFSVAVFLRSFVGLIDAKLLNVMITFILHSDHTLSRRRSVSRNAYHSTQST